MTARAATHSRARTLLLALPLAVAVVLTTAAPGVAAKGSGATVTRYAAQLSFGEGTVAGSFTDDVSDVSLADYVSAEYYDRLLVQPGGSQFVTVNRGNGFERCRHDVNKGLKTLSVYGAQRTWAAMAVGSAMGSRVEIQCLTDDGKQHVLHWGNRKNPDGTYDLSGTSNCVDLTRISATEFRITVPLTGCDAQDEVINSRVQQVGTPVLRSMPFTATFTLTAGAPVPAS